MKYIITALLIFMSMSISAQKRSTQTSTTVSDDDNRLRVSVHSNANGKEINYKNEFDIKGLSKEEKDKIVDHIMDSLGISNTKITSTRTTANSTNFKYQSTISELYSIAEKFNQQQVDAFNRGDLLGVAQFYSDDAMIYHPGKIYQGREAINNYWTDIKGAKSWKLTIKEVGGDKKSFWVAGLSELTAVSNGVDRTFASNYIVIMQPDKNGNFKIYKDIYNQAPNK